MLVPAQQQEQRPEQPQLQQEQPQPVEEGSPGAEDLDLFASSGLDEAGSSASGPSLADEPPGAAPGSSGQRRCRSPFLARDCSGIDVWTPDRYARWVGKQLGPDGQKTEDGRRGGSPAGRTSLPAAGSAGFRWRDYVDSVEAAEMGVSWAQAGAGRTAAAANPTGDGSGTGLRGAIKSMLSWMADRLGPSHPIELTPSELGSYGSAHSSPVCTPYTGSPAGGEGSRSRYHTPASGGLSYDSRTAHALITGGSGSSSAGLRRSLGEAQEGPAPAAGGVAGAGAAAMPWSGVRNLHYGGSEGGSAAGSSAASCSSSHCDGDSAGCQADNSACWGVCRGSLTSWDGASHAASKAAAEAALTPPAHDRGHLAAAGALPHRRRQRSSGNMSSSSRCGAGGLHNLQQQLQHDSAQPARCSSGGSVGVGGSLLSAENSEEQLYHTPRCCSPQKASAAGGAAAQQP